MPNYDKKNIGTRNLDDLEVSARILRTIQKQVEQYSLALEKVQNLKREIQIDEQLQKQLQSSPESMLAVLESRGIAKPIAAGMVAEDIGHNRFPGGELAFWTFHCCCTVCCLTCFTSGGDTIVKKS